MKQHWELFLSFFKIGAFTFGGGYAMIPLIAREADEKRGWITEQALPEIIAISEATPGPIAVNAATFIGYQVCGIWGAFFATLGVVLPSFVSICLIYALLQHFSEYAAVRYAFFGVRAGVLALLLRALWTLFRKQKKTTTALVIMAGAFVAAAVLHINAFYILLASTLIGLLCSAIRRCR